MAESPAADRRIAADITIQIVGRLLNAGLGVVATLILIRALGDDGFGQWATVFAVVEIVGYAGALGLEQLAVRYAATDREREGEWIGAVVSLKFALALLVIPLMLVILFLLSESDEMRATAVITSALMFTGALSAARGVFQLRVRNDVSVVILTINSVLWTLAVIALAGASGSMVAFALAFLAVAVVSTGIEFVWAIRTQPLRFRGSTQHWGVLLRGGIPLGLAGLVTLAYVRIDGVLVFQIAGADEAGLYAAVYRVLDRAQMIPTAVMTTLFPLLAAAWPADPARVRALVQAAVDNLMVIALPALALTIAASKEIVILLLGDEFEEASPALAVLMGAFVALSFWHLAQSMVIVIGRQRRLIAYTVVALFFNVALNLILIPSYGFMAAAWITLGTEVLVMALTFGDVLQQTAIRLELRRLLLTALSATLMGLAVAGLLDAGVGVILAASMSLVVYAAALLAFRAVDFNELRGLLRRA
jgi:O-antigen/teichoic acid export membrane protein